MERRPYQIRHVVTNKWGYLTSPGLMGGALPFYFLMSGILEPVEWWDYFMELP
jgi:hypothetical protein